jgi:hypothetical protein
MNDFTAKNYSIRQTASKPTNNPTAAELDYATVGLLTPSSGRRRTFSFPEFGSFRVIWE